MELDKYILNNFQKQNEIVGLPVDIRSNNGNTVTDPPEITLYDNSTRKY